MTNLIIIVFLFTLNAGIVICDNILTEENASSAGQTGLILHLRDLTEGLERVEISVEIINRRQLRQINDFKNIISKCHTDVTTPAVSQTNEDACEEVMFYANETFSKCIRLNEKLLMELTETHKNSVLSPEELQVKCKDLESNLIANVIVGKLKVFEEKLNNFSDLEAKLTEQQISHNEFSENLMQNLLKVKAKLQENEQKFLKYHRELPDLNNFSNKINNLANWKQWRLRHLPQQ